ncbi:LexA family protein [Rhizobium sp. SGZ-381]|uniref:LexA family protein n=1 Tax=Rhizobium sp. SGZ-381 TaxID=3342800 RepID=UPI00366F61AE
MGLQAAISIRMTTLRDQQLAWLNHIGQSANMTLTEIARAAGLTPSTLTRFANNNENGHTLTAKTVKRIEDATRVPAYESRVIPRVQTFSEDEAQRYVAAEAKSPMEKALRQASQEARNVHLWTLKTNSLAAVGYSAGMVVVVDQDETPRNGDAVCAQKYDYRRGTAETIFRVYRTPYLLSAFLDAEPLMPEIVDNENIAIAGVVVGGFRLRH